MHEEIKWNLTLYCGRSGLNCVFCRIRWDGDIILHKTRPKRTYRCDSCTNFATPIHLPPLIYFGFFAFSVSFASFMFFASLSSVVVLLANYHRVMPGSPPKYNKSSFDCSLLKQECAKSKQFSYYTADSPAPPGLMVQLQPQVQMAVKPP